MQSPNPEYHALVMRKFTNNRFAHFIGFEMDLVEPGRTEGHLVLKAEHQQQAGYAHGGLLLTLCDIVAGFAAFTMVQDDELVVTAEIKVSCLRPGIGDRLIARGMVLKPGRNIHFCESEVWAVQDGKEILVAKSSSSMAVVRGRNQ